jgi:hypothetical protein
VQIVACPTINDPRDKREKMPTPRRAGAGRRYS